MKKKYTKLFLFFLFILTTTVTIHYSASTTEFFPKNHKVYITKLSPATLQKIVPLVTQKNVIFDLGGVLFKPKSKRKILKEVGWGTLAGYTINSILRFSNPKKLQKRFMHFLNTIQPSQTRKYQYNGNPLPGLMHAWQTGQKTGKEILKKIDHAIAQLDKEKFFKSSWEKKIFKKLSRIIFSPEMLVNKSLEPLQSGIDILKSFKLKKNSNGQPKHKLYLLSNFDKETLALFRKKYPEIFNLFHGMVISGEIGYMKPDKEIYQHLLNLYKLDPAQCIFIDDQQENLLTAKELGITGVHFS